MALTTHNLLHRVVRCKRLSTSTAVLQLGGTTAKLQQYYLVIIAGMLQYRVVVIAILQQCCLVFTAVLLQYGEIVIAVSRGRGGAVSTFYM